MRGVRLPKMNLPGLKKPREDEGATLVEMALSLCFIMLPMLFGIFEMTLALYTYHYVSDAAREGSRWAMVRGSTSCTNTPGLSDCGASSTGIANYVKTLGYPGIDSTANMTVTTSWFTPVLDTTNNTTTWSSCTPSATVVCNQPGYAVQVKVTYAFPIGIPYWKLTTINVSSTSQTVYAQ